MKSVYILVLGVVISVIGIMVINYHKINMIGLIVNLIGFIVIGIAIYRAYKGIGL